MKKADKTLVFTTLLCLLPMAAGLFLWDRLPQEMKLVVTLRFFEDMKLSEIAQVTGAGVNTVKTRLYRALAQLRLTMGEEEEA